MNTAEIIVWAMMAGGLLALALMSVADILMTRSTGSVRTLLVILAISSTCVLLSGLPEVMFPTLPAQPLMMFKVLLGPLSSALGLWFLGIWIGGVREDRLVYRSTAWGSYFMLLATLVLVLLGSMLPSEDHGTLLMAAALITGLAVLLTLLVGVRATLLGDPLARWLVLACTVLAGMVGGLYLRAMGVQGPGLLIWIVTAACAVVFLLIVLVLMVLRNQTNRRLARLARLETGSDPATGLPTGARLLADVEHAFWRTGRLGGQCTVVCVYLDNLYAPGSALGHTIENQILAATAARIRRAAGFRCVVGLYHPRCFVIVFSTERRQPVAQTALQHIRRLVTQPLQLVGSHDQRQEFVPRVGMAVLTALPDQAQPQAVIHEAEHLAMEELRRSPTSDEQADTTW